MELLALLLCLELIVSFSYLGFISIPPISVTTLHILVIIAAMYFGPLEAGAIALVFAGASIWKASTTSTEVGDIAFSPALSGKPIESLIMALGARVVFALIAGLLFRWFFRKERRHRKLGIAGITIVTTLIHSALVYACMAAFFGAAEAETGGSFGRSLFLNNLLLYSVTVLLVLLFDSIMRRKKVKDFFDITSEGGKILSKGQNRISMMLVVIIILLCIFICLHFLSRLDRYFRSIGGSFESIYGPWIYALLFQLIVGLAATFIMLALAFRWNREYYSALATEADRKARESAEKANKAKSDFLFNMSHDIRTPMNAIMGFTGIARKHIDDREKVAECLDKAQQSGNILLSLINSVLEVSRIESGHAELETQPGDIYYSFINIENTMLELAKTKDIDLSFEITDIKDRYVLCDFSRCIRIFVNVISNAIKYTPEGGTVKVRCEQLGSAENGIGTYRYTVTDNGIGMGEEFQKHIFEQFSRENTSTVSGIQGTGLGLTVVKSFVDLMGGSINVQSKRGAGTVFSIILPFRLQEGASYTDPATGTVVLAESKVAHAKEAHFTGKRILLVEDNELNREIAAEVLEEEGFIVEDACDGVEAVEKIRQNGPDHYDFVLMDIQMPNMNGYEATRTIRSMYPQAKLPIIALSANAFAEDKRASREAGMDDHVAKPINQGELFSIMARFL